jgi:hypothetical protein
VTACGLILFIDDFLCEGPSDLCGQKGDIPETIPPTGITGIDDLGGRRKIGEDEHLFSGFYAEVCAVDGTYGINYHFLSLAGTKVFSKEIRCGKTA